MGRWGVSRADRIPVRIPVTNNEDALRFFKDSLRSGRFFGEGLHRKGVECRIVSHILNVVEADEDGYCSIALLLRRFVITAGKYARAEVCHKRTKSERPYLAALKWFRAVYRPHSHELNLRLREIAAEELAATRAAFQ